MSPSKRRAKSSKKSDETGDSAAKAGATGAVVAAWEDDPGDPQTHPPLVPITVTAPNPAAPPLPFKIGGPKPAPKVYQPGTRGRRCTTRTPSRRTSSSNRTATSCSSAGRSTAGLTKGKGAA